jgi:hypothetical protein
MFVQGIVLQKFELTTHLNHNPPNAPYPNFHNPKEQQMHVPSHHVMCILNNEPTNNNNNNNTNN